MTRRFFLLAGGAALTAIGGLVVACGSSDESSGNAPTAANAPTDPSAPTAVHAAPVPFEQLLPGFVDALCGPIEACCNDQGYDFKPGACAASFAGAGDAGVPGVNITLAVPGDAGLTYDPQAAGDCLVALRAYQQTCATPVATPAEIFTVLSGASLASTAALSDSFAACERLFTGGQTPLGAPCTQSYECKSSVPNSTPGCSTSTPDDGGPPVRHCIEILPTAADGAHCTGSIEDGLNGPSGQYTPCAGNGKFDPKNGTLAGLGVCNQTTLTCTSYVVAPDGQHCDNVTTICGAASFCNTSSVCQPGAQVGAACGSGVRCITTATCSTDRICVAQAPLGAACTDDNDCASGNCNQKHVCSSALRGVANARLCGG